MKDRVKQCLEDLKRFTSGEGSIDWECAVYRETIRFTFDAQYTRDEYEAAKKLFEQEEEKFKELEKEYEYHNKKAQICKAMLDKAFRDHEEARKKADVCERKLIKYKNEKVTRLDTPWKK
jgi:septal ring factor EnvC (AmiA/AmiB activator)